MQTLKQNKILICIAILILIFDVSLFFYKPNAWVFTESSLSESSKNVANAYLINSRQIHFKNDNTKTSLVGSYFFYDNSKCTLVLFLRFDSKDSKFDIYLPHGFVVKDISFKNSASLNSNYAFEDYLTWTHPYTDDESRYSLSVDVEGLSESFGNVDACDIVLLADLHIEKGSCITDCGFNTICQLNNYGS